MTLLRQRKYLVISQISLILFLSSCRSSIPKELKVHSVEIPEIVDYNFHVKPILSDRCYKCHGPDENQLKSNFRVSSEEFAFKKTESSGSKYSETLVRGMPQKSELMNRLLSKDLDVQMPPHDSHLTVSNKEKAIINRWIEQGANFKPHWSFIPPSKPSLIRKSDEWAQNDIDQFILKKLEENKLKPSSKVDEEVLLRRVYFDITGLPPSVEEMDDFMKSDHEDPYEETIDQLLDSPHYGENMTVRWLDLARYADTHGYQDDGLRTAWPYRDWVIEAFNENKPYDQFLTEQLAGDLIPNATKDQLVATCFLRNHPQTQEGGIVDEEYRVEYVADRTNTFGKAMLGLTMECARCHDHKYDPLSQKDYYSLYAYFNNNNESGIVPYVGEASPTVILPTEEESKIIDSLKVLIEPLEQKLVSENYIDDFKEWMLSSPELVVSDKGLLASFDFEEMIEVNKSELNLDGEKSPGWGGIGKKGKTLSFVNKAKNKADAAVFGDVDRVPELVKGVKGNGLKFIGDCGFRFNRDMDMDRHEEISVSIWMRLDQDDANGPIFNNSNGNFEGYRGWLAKLNEDQTISVQFNHVWPDNSIDYQTKDQIVKNEWIHLAISYDGSSDAEGLDIYVNGEKPELILHENNLNKSILNGKDGKNWSSMPFIIGKELTQSLLGVSLDEMKVYNRKLSSIEVRKLFNDQNSFKPSENDMLKHYTLSGNNTEYNKARKDLNALRSVENEVMTNMTEVMTMSERKIPRKSFILERGAYDAPSEVVNPELPSQLKTKSEFNGDRLGLANWLVSDENPLTARVTVNRIWAMIFGKGLVNTIDDFGNQGSLPSHPELLDWLAIDFIENGWDVKRIMKQILMSSTYQQSAYGAANSREQDPENKWYSRFPKHRLTAEAIRDRALAASGLLVKDIGGPSVYPYQPKGLWKELATRNETEYKQGRGDELYRRSMYTIWKRSSPPPMMISFDAPDRYICAVDRQKTSTPLQSLVLLNDPQYLEAAKILALKAIKSVQKDQIQYVFKSLINRIPSDEELSILQELRIQELNEFETHPLRIRTLLNIGERRIEESKETAELASLMIVASTIMNYDEFVLKT